MKLLTPARVVLSALSAVLPAALVCASAYTVDAQTGAGAGLIVAVDVGKNTLVLETRDGVRHVTVAPAAAIRGDHGEALAFGELRPGDAVSYPPGSDSVTTLRVARQFWALPAS